VSSQENASSRLSADASGKLVSSSDSSHDSILSCSPDTASLNEARDAPTVQWPGAALSRGLSESTALQLTPPSRER
jgi:hypothetical protein